MVYNSLVLGMEATWRSLAAIAARREMVVLRGRRQKEQHLVQDVDRQDVDREVVALARDHVQKSSLKWLTSLVKHGSSRLFFHFLLVFDLLKSSKHLKQQGKGRLMGLDAGDAPAEDRFQCQEGKPTATEPRHQGIGELEQDAVEALPIAEPRGWSWPFM